MAENANRAIEITIDSQVPDISVESSQKEAAGVNEQSPEEMPGVTKLLNRKKLSLEAGSANSAAPTQSESGTLQGPPRAPQLAIVSSEPKIVTEFKDISQPKAVNHKSGLPPVFQGELVLECQDLKSLQKSIKRHKNSTKLKKLDCMEYFSGWFSEITYFEVSEQGVLSGILGWGNNTLVTQTATRKLTQELLPSIFEVLLTGEVFAGSIESLRTEDKQGFEQLGFTGYDYVGAFPIQFKKAVTGLWLCAGKTPVEIEPKELKALKKLFLDFVL